MTGCFTLRCGLVFLGCVVAGACVAQERVSSDDNGAGRGEAVERGLAFVAKTGEQWIKKQQCVTCHQIPSLIWSHRVAANYGVPPSEKLEDWEAWSTDVVSFVKPGQKQDVDFNTVLEANVDTATQLLLAIPRPSGGKEAKWRDAFAQRLRQLQATDGSWRACGQLPLQKRPERETHAVTTLWTSLALIREEADFDEAAALKFAEVESAQSIEWFAARLLVEASRATSSEDRINSLREQIVAEQNADGGWGWTIGDESDALGTGFALYALKSTGRSHAKPLRAATEYLVQTQRSDGSWQVPGTKRSAKGRVTATATDWGSAWAVVALAAEQQ